MNHKTITITIPEDVLLRLFAMGKRHPGKTLAEEISRNAHGHAAQVVNSATALVKAGEMARGAALGGLANTQLQAAKELAEIIAGASESESAQAT